MGFESSFEDGFDGIRAAILRAALDPYAWQDVVQYIAKTVNNGAAHFLGQDSSYSGTDYSTIAGYDPAAVAPFAEHFQFVNPLRDGWSKLPTGTFCSHHSIMGESAWRRTEYCSDWLRPQNLTGAVGVVLAQEHGRVFLLGIQTRDEATERLAAQLSARLYPLMRHALDVNRTMMGLRLDALSLRVGREPATAAILALTTSGTVAYANTRAEGMMSAGRMLSLAPTGRLRIHDSQLQTMVDAALRRRNASARVSISDNASRLTVDLVPLDERLGADIAHGPFGHACDPRLVLILSQPAPPEDPADRLAKSLGLTTTEAQIALAMADGKTLAEISETRRTSIHTVRNQLKSLLLKTGTRRQSEVVALVERLRRSP